MLDVDRRDDVDPGVEQLLDVLPALLVAASPGRWCARARRPARPSGCRASTASTSISVERRRRGSSSSRRGTTSRPSSSSAVCARPCVSTKPDDDVGAALEPPVALAEHGEVLPDARRGAEVDAQPPAAHASPQPAAMRLQSRRQVSRVERQVELEDVDPRLTEEPERPALGVLGRPAAAPGDRRARGPRRRGDLESAYAGLMCGSSPEPLAVQRVRRHRPRRARRRAAATAARRSSHGPDQVGAARPEVRRAGRRRVVAVARRDGRLWKYAGSLVGRLADQRRADDLAGAVHQRAVGVVRATRPERCR